MFTPEEKFNFICARIEDFCTYMQTEKIDAVIFRDSEEFRNPAVRYFSGMPSDAILAIKNDGQTILNSSLSRKITASIFSVCM